jgi:hypothetical protein
MKLYWTGVLLCATATVSASFPCSAESTTELQSTAVEVNAPIVTALAPADPIITTQPAAVTTESSSDSAVPLSGYVKQHKHPFLALLKQEFNSPIHTISTNSKNY